MDGGIDGATALPDVVETVPCDAARAARSPLGCDYWIAPVHGTGSEYCSAVLISNPHDKPVQFAVERNAMKLDVTTSSRLLVGSGVDPGWRPLEGNSLPAGSSAVVALADGALDSFGRGKCPFPPLADASAFLEDIASPAFHLSSSSPLFAVYYHAYGVPQGGWLTATTALRATSSWGTDYIDVGILSPGRPDPQVFENDSFNLDAEAFTMLLASERTEITLHGPNGGISRTLEAGTAQRLDRNDLFIGTTISSTMPIAVVVGAPEPFVPYNVSSADSLINQIPPTDAWTSEYAAAGFPTRRAGFEDAPLYRIIAARAGTRLDFNPAPPVGAASVLEAGGLAVFRSSQPFVVRSQDEQHPFYVSVAMTGSGPLCDRFGEDGGPPHPPEDVIYRNCPGDPELVGILPASEYARRFSFVTGHDFADTYLVLVRKRSDAGNYVDVHLDCAGVVDGWQPIGRDDTYETVTLPLARGEFEPQTYPGGTCTLGPHRMWSDAPFTGYLWAWSHHTEAFSDCNYPLCEDGGARSYGFALHGLASAATDNPK